MDHENDTRRASRPAAERERDALRAACRLAYQVAWQIEQTSTEPFTVLRASEIKRVTMDALQATNAEQAARQTLPEPPTDTEGP
jgi:hypothetical protein